MQSVDNTTELGNSPSSSDRLDRWLNKTILVALFLIAIFGPISIAATQTAWALGLCAWLLRLTLRRGPKLWSTPLDLSLAAFLALSLLSTLFSYDRTASMGRLPGLILFTIAYLVVENTTSKRMVRALAITLLASASLTAIYVLGDRVMGHGVRVDRLSTSGVLQELGVEAGDTILEVNGVRVNSPIEIIHQMNSVRTAGGEFRVDRFGLEFSLTIHPLAAPLSNEDLGLEDWSISRSRRAAGLYGHYTTYADVSQLLGSLAFGLFVCARRKTSINGVAALLAVLTIGAGLFLTFTRAPWLAFLASVTVILIIGASRKTAIAVLAILLLIVPVGLYAFREKRQIGFIDQKDTSTSWRQTVWREGFNLLISSPRHLLVGIGTDSLANRELTSRWGLFDHGRLPPGHMHSNFLGLALDRGVPALLAWIVFLSMYMRTLWKLVKERTQANWVERGVSLGALGGSFGLILSGVFHYNWVDSEVVMIFYFIMGLNLTLAKLTDHN